MKPKRALDRLMAGFTLPRDPDWGRDRKCETCGNVRPFVKRNANGVEGWAGCRGHAAVNVLLAYYEATRSTRWPNGSPEESARAAVERTGIL